MGLVQRIRLSRDRTLTAANLVDRLLLRKGDCEVGVEEGG